MKSISKTDDIGTKFWVKPGTEKWRCYLGILQRSATGKKYWLMPDEKFPQLPFDTFGIVHKEDGPAIEWMNSKEWYINGKHHREDGPATEYNDGTIYWFLNDRRVLPTIKMMEKYIKSNPDNISKNYHYPLEIQTLAISLKKDVIFNIPYPHIKLKELYPQLMALRNSGLI